MNIVVFLGPSLPVADARAILDAQYLPPAKMGDVYAVVEREQPDAIGIVDGYFDSVPSVWHKEILVALSRGVRVVGASSMGALRAAELSIYGMEGVGWVFDAYRSGVLEDDDEVAIAHASADKAYRNLSEAMVNLRVGLTRACERGVIRADTRDTLVALGKACFYPERSWGRLLRDGANSGLDAEELSRLDAFVKTERPDIKREDARLLLERLARQSPGAAFEPAPELPPTIFWDKLAGNERTEGSVSVAVRGEDLRRFVKATDREAIDLMRDSLLVHLAYKESEALAIDITQEQFDATVRDFRLRHDLDTAADMRSWLERAGISAAQFKALMYVEARIGALLAVYRTEVDRHLLDALALSGGLGDTLEALAKARGAADTEGVSHEQLEAFYRSRVRQFAGSLNRHARELGFSSSGELLDQIRKIYEPSMD